jgi:hypothetical protein
MKEVLVTVDDETEAEREEGEKDEEAEVEKEATGTTSFPASCSCCIFLYCSSVINDDFSYFSIISAGRSLTSSSLNIFINCSGAAPRLISNSQYNHPFGSFFIILKISLFLNEITRVLFSTPS